MTRPFTLANKLNAKEPWPSNWHILGSRNEISSVEKALDRGTIFIVPGQGCETIQETEMRDHAEMKMSEKGRIHHVSIRMGVRRIFEVQIIRSKLGGKEPPASDSVAMSSSNWIASVGNASDRLSSLF
jgi:hypothetical protein